MIEKGKEMNYNPNYKEVGMLYGTFNANKNRTQPSLIKQ